MIQALKRSLALLLLLSLLPGAVPAVSAKTDAVRIETFMSTGDALWMADMSPVDTANALIALADMYKEFGITRVYWRGLQQSLWTEVQVSKDEAVIYQANSDSIAEQSARFEKNYGMSWNRYFVNEAHKRGIEVWGVSNLQDWGSAADIACNYWPFHHQADFLIEHPEWVPVDKYGLIKQGGAVNLTYTDARKTLVKLHAKAIEADGYDGVAFLTYTENYSIMYDDQFGYNTDTVKGFEAKFGGITPGIDDYTLGASPSDWRRYRGEFVTKFFKELKTAMDDGTGLGLFLDPREPYYTQSWSPGLPKDAIYLDLVSYVRDEIIDQFIVFGNASAIQTDTVEDLLFLTRGTKTGISVQSSSTGRWNSYSSAENLSYCISLNGEEYYYTRIPIENRTQFTDINVKLSQIALGTAKGTAEDVTPYLAPDTNLVTLRLAIKALSTIAPQNGADLLEPLLLHEEPGVRGLAAAEIRKLCDLDTVDRLMEAIDKHSEFTLYQAATVTLGTNVSKYAAKLMEYYKTSSNPRVRAAAMRALSYGSHLSYLDTFVKAVKTEFAPADAADYVDGYYDSIRYFAAQCIGNIGSNSSIRALTDIAEGWDTVAGSRAVISMGEMAAKGLLTTPAQQQTLIDSLDGLFSRMGDASTRPDRDWAYRPIGEALLRLGDGGRAVLEGYLRQTEDTALALLAWKVLYIPYRLQGYAYMTETEYDDAYAHLPNILRQYNVTDLSQDFEDTKVFSKSTSGFTGTVGKIGRWGSFSSQFFAITTEDSHSGSQSVKANAGSNELFGTIGTPMDGTYQFSFWIKRSEGASLLFKTMEPNRKGEIVGLIDKDGSVLFEDPVSGQNVGCGLTVPAGEWVQMRVVANRTSKKLIASLADESGRVTEAPVQPDFAVVPTAERVYFQMKSKTGHFYLDDIAVAEATVQQYERPASVTVSVKDQTAVYTARPQKVVYTTNPAGMTVEFIYEGIDGTAYEKTSKAPTLAGKYRITATVMGKEVGTATLTVIPALGRKDTAKESAAPLGAAAVTADSEFRFNPGGRMQNTLSVRK